MSSNNDNFKKLLGQYKTPEMPEYMEAKVMEALPKTKKWNSLNFNILFVYGVFLSMNITFRSLMYVYPEWLQKYQTLSDMLLYMCAIIGATLILQWIIRETFIKLKKQNYKL